MIFYVFFMFQFTDKTASSADSVSTENRRHDGSDAIDVTEHVDATVPPTSTSTPLPISNEASLSSVDNSIQSNSNAAEATEGM